MPDRVDVVTVTPNRLCPIRLPLMKPNTAGIAARIMKYPVYRPLTVAGSAAITGHSLFGDSRIDLKRSTSFAVSITRLLPRLALAWNVLVVVARMMAAAPGGSPKLRPAAAGWPTRKSTLRFFRRAAPDQTTWKQIGRASCRERVCQYV